MGLLTVQTVVLEVFPIFSLQTLPGANQLISLDPLHNRTEGGAGQLLSAGRWRGK